MSYSRKEDTKNSSIDSLSALGVKARKGNLAKKGRSWKISHSIVVTKRHAAAAVIKPAIVNLNKTTRPLRHCIQAQKQIIYFICISLRTIAIVCSTLM